MSKKLAAKTPPVQNAPATADNTASPWDAAPADSSAG